MTDGAALPAAEPHGCQAVYYVRVVVYEALAPFSGAFIDSS